MKKRLAGSAILALCTNAALAQTAVNIYGIADAGFVHESGGVASVNKLTSGVGSASRIGFRGTEDLGSGMSALFTLETGYRIDTGEVDAAGTIFNRQAFVGLKSRAGTLTLGRQYTPWHNALAQVADPFGTGFAGGAKNLFPDFGTNVRASNTVIYAAPAMAGFSADVAYSAGEQPGSNSAGRQFGASLGYAAGPLNLRLAYNNKNSDVAAATGVTAVSRSIGTNILLAANYDFKVLKAYFAYGIDKGFNSAPLGNSGTPFGGVKPTASTDGNEILVGLSAQLGTGTVLASVMRKDDKTSFNQDAHSWGLGYLYPLSKRTNLYAVYGAISNKNGAGYTVANNTEAGTGNRASNLGVRHTF
ncbi:porin [Massilia norwichensis]|uniref:Porin n=1 Tax=Massilia norwichensis TaxID=1442366 RepID=A0ABT2AC89_9BURK|nr:porin [Massilia norwichensis]MCS0591833.1 porin [Massilia norwichensis]